MSPRRAPLRLLAALAVLGTLTGPALAAAPDVAALGLQPYDPPKAAPAFTLPDLDGTPRSLAALRGKVVLLFFWATW